MRGTISQYVLDRYHAVSGICVHDLNNYSIKIECIHSVLLWIQVCFYLSTSPSAGVGRTGTFITLDAMMERLKEKDDLNIFEFVNEMRTRRMCMVQTVVSPAVIMNLISPSVAISCIWACHFGSHIHIERVYYPAVHRDQLVAAL